MPPGYGGGQRESAHDGLAAAAQAEAPGGQQRRAKGRHAPPAPSHQYTGTSADLRAAVAPVEETLLAQRGWRRRVRVLTLGLIKPKASPEEIAEAHWRRLATSEWSRPMTVLIANPKGGVGKTPGAAAIAATFGVLRGGSVLDWDNNETFGTAGIRTAPGRFPTTVIDLLAQLEHFETRTARKGQLNAFIRAQADGNFHVLASDEDPGRMAVLGETEFNRIHAVVGRYYDLIVVDTGNNSRAPNFVAAANRTDQLVIPVQWAQDSVQSAGRLIDQLHKAGLSDLVARAVIVVSHDGRGSAPAAKAAAWRAWFERTCAAVFVVPFDPHIAERDQILYSKLAEPTRTAYLQVAAGIAAGLNQIDAAAVRRIVSHYNTTETGGQQ